MIFAARDGECVTVIHDSTRPSSVKMGRDNVRMRLEWGRCNGGCCGGRHREEGGGEAGGRWGDANRDGGIDSRSELTATAECCDCLG